MGWSNAEYDDQWDYFQSYSTMSYLDYIMVAACLVILALAIFFLLQECCTDSSSEDSAAIIHREDRFTPHYTETTTEREHAHGHRIAHEFNRHQNVVLLSSSKPLLGQQPPPYYAYDTTSRATYYMYPTSPPHNMAGNSNASTSEQLVQRGYVDMTPSSGNTARPPPYAPNH